MTRPGPVDALLDEILRGRIAELLGLGHPPEAAAARARHEVLRRARQTLRRHGHR